MGSDFIGTNDGIDNIEITIGRPLAAFRYDGESEHALSTVLCTVVHSCKVNSGLALGFSCKFDYFDDTSVEH